MSKHYDYTTENLLDYFYHENYYELIGTGLSRQINMRIPQCCTKIGRRQWCYNVFYCWKAAKN